MFVDFLKVFEKDDTSVSIFLNTPGWGESGLPLSVIIVVFRSLRENGCRDETSSDGQANEKIFRHMKIIKVLISREIYNRLAMNLVDRFLPLLCIKLTVFNVINMKVWKYSIKD